MTIRSRAATPADIPAIIQLALFDADARGALDLRLWAPAPDQATRIETGLRTALSQPDGLVGWRVLEIGGSVVGASRFAVIPSPPVYDLGAGRAGIILDDTYVVVDAPAQALDVLAADVEAEAQRRGAVVIVAACPAKRDVARRAFERRGYETVTLYMARHGLSGVEAAAARRAVEEDIPQIVALNRASQEYRQKLSPRFWKAHPDASARFESWMTESLKSIDRQIFVDGPAETLAGFIVAQSMGVVHLPLACASSHIGLVDDFCALEFDPFGSGSPSTGEASRLLAAAENAFRRQGKESAMVICPAGWTSKRDLLIAHGYEIGNVWLLKSRGAGAS